MKRYYDGEITKLRSNEIFVFGSNTGGIHGAGAALLAKQKFGAINGQPWGLQGQSFAIPTQNHQTWQGLELSDICDSVDGFATFAKLHPELDFLVTPIGTGLAGYKDRQIAPLFDPITDNVILPIVFYEALKNHRRQDPSQQYSG